jgi:DUF4097 and DUF4098 domain-containing protein YvlB
MAPRKPLPEALAAVLAALVAAAPAAAQQTVEQRQAADPNGRVVIDSQAGSIKVVGWNKDEVQVTGTLGRGAEGVTLTRSGRRTDVEVEVRGNPHRARNDLEVRVPAGSDVEVDSFASAISVEGVKGRVLAETVNGSIGVGSGAAEVRVEAVNGDVTVTAPHGRVHAEAVNGDVTVTDGRGELEASAVTGTLKVVGGAFERAQLEVVSGSLEFSSDLAPRASLDVQSVSGEVVLRFPAGVNAEFSVSTFSGEIENELGPPATKKGRFSPQRTLNFTAGSGGASVTVQTVSGGVQILKR